MRNQHRSLQGKQVKLAFGTVALILILGATVIWVLSRGSEPWSSIFSIIFSVLGLLIAVLQWHSQVTSKSHVADIIPSMQKLSLHTSSIRSVDDSASMSEKKGALIVHGRRSLQGATINLGRGFNTMNLKTHFASNVVEREESGFTVFRSVFPLLEPGSYTAHVNSGQLVARVTIHPGQIAEIDWR